MPSAQKPMVVTTMAKRRKRAVFNHAHDELPAQAEREPALVCARGRNHFNPKAKT